MMDLLRPTFLFVVCAGLVVVRVPQAASNHLGGCLHGTSSDGSCNGWQSASGNSKAYNNGAGVCSEGTFGSTCTSACPSGCLIDDCELENGECVGPTTTWSSISGNAKAYGNGTGICRQGVFGADCSKKCPAHCLITDCEVENGECVGPTTTWTDISGNAKAYGNGGGICQPGFFGSTCSNTCPLNCLIQDCEVENGECVGPTATWTSISGDAKAYGDGSGICRPGFFGSTCSNACPSNCLIIDCEVENGECVGPKTTWSQISGDAKAFGNGTGICKAGFYGSTCTNVCPVHCLSTDCEVENGECVGPHNTWSSISGNAPAFGGGSGICQSSYWGSDCSKKCPAACPFDCTVENGQCLS